MSELSAISAFPAVAVVSIAAPQATPVAGGGPAFGAVLRESLSPGAGQPAVIQNSGRSLVPMPAPATEAATADPMAQALVTAISSGTLAQQAAGNGASAASQATPAGTNANIQSNGVAPGPARQNLADSATSSAAVIAAAAAPGMPLPVQPVSVAASRVAADSGGQAGQQTANQAPAFGLPAGFTGTMTYIGDSTRAALGTPMLARPSVPSVPISASQPNPSPVLDLTPGPISTARAATMMSAPPITWMRGLSSVELPRVEIGADIAGPPATFTATQMTPAPVTAAPVAAEPEMPEVSETPEEPEAGEAIAPGFDALSHASAEVGLPGDLINRVSAAQTATTAYSRLGAGAQPAAVEDASTGETDADPAPAAEVTEAASDLPRAASAATASAYETASVAAAGRAADVTSAGARPDAELVLRETVRSSQPRTLAGAQAAQAAASTAPVSGRVVDQVANGLSLAVREGRTEAVLTLRPEALGEVRVQIVSGPEGLTIRLSAERQSVGELLRSGISDLQDALAGRQLAVAEVHVMPNPSTAAPATVDTPLWQERPWSRQQPEAEDREQPRPRQPQDEQDDE